MLYMSGETRSVGRVDSGDTVMDFLPQERERGITISSAAISFNWKNTTINLIDTPGHVDFTIEVERSVRVMDGVCVIVDAVSGVQAQTRTVWKQCQKQGLPAIAFVNKMDREGAMLNTAVQSLKNKLGISAIPVQLPVGREKEFSGVIDLIGMKKLIFKKNSSRTPPPPEIMELHPDDPIMEEALQARIQMLESIAELDEEFLELYLLAGEKEDTVMQPSPEEILNALRRICRSSSGIPLICGSALKGIGVEPLLDAISCFLPAPTDRPPFELQNAAAERKQIVPNSQSPMVALVFKIVHDQGRGGTLSFVRIYSGKLYAKDVLYNSSQMKRERVHQLFKISADDLIPISSVESGDLACIVGMKNTVTGDTILTEKSGLESYRLSGLEIPASVFSLSIEPAKSSQQAELEKCLELMCLEDPSLQYEINVESGQTLLRGIGELHIDIVCDKLRRQYGIEVTTHKAYVAYRESIDPEMEPISELYTYDRNLGLKRLYAEMEVIFSPIKSVSGKENEVILPLTSQSSIHIAKTVRKGLSAQQLDALEVGLRTAFSRGPAGYPVVGLSISVLSVNLDADSTPGAIQACASSLVSHILESGRGVVLEPVMLLEADVPCDITGDVLGDLSANRRAVVKEVTSNPDGSRSNIIALAPLASILGYSTAFRSITKGEGSFSMEYMQHQQVT